MKLLIRYIIPNIFPNVIKTNKKLDICRVLAICQILFSVKKKTDTLIMNYSFEIKINCILLQTELLFIES